MVGFGRFLLRSMLALLISTWRGMKLSLLRSSAEDLQEHRFLFVSCFFLRGGGGDPPNVVYLPKEIDFI